MFNVDEAIRQVVREELAVRREPVGRPILGQHRPLFGDGSVVFTINRDQGDEGGLGRRPNAAAGKNIV